MAPHTTSLSSLMLNLPMVLTKLSSLPQRLVSRLLLLLVACFPFALLAAESEQLIPGTMEARVAACVHCHGANGRAGPDGFYPRIAGKPAGYLFAQLVSFRDGGR